jgi:hypothetical protein
MTQEQLNTITVLTQLLTVASANGNTSLRDKVILKLEELLDTP